MVRVLCYQFSSIDSLSLSDTVLRCKRTSLVSHSATKYKLHKMTNKLANLKLYELWVYGLFIVGVMWDCFDSADDIVVGFWVFIAMHLSP